MLTLKLYRKCIDCSDIEINITYKIFKYKKVQNDNDEHDFVAVDDHEVILNADTEYCKVQIISIV